MSFRTLGCRLNRSESDETVRALEARGLRVGGGAEDPGPDDVVVVNTCTVTADASRSSRKLVRKAAASGARVVVTGCYAVAEPETCAGLPGVVEVVANTDKADLAAVVATLPGVQTAGQVGHGSLDQVRGAFKVQSGCDEGCTFCIIPTTRGALSSRPADAVVAGVREQVGAGVREVALTGVHLGKYGVDVGQGRALAPLVRRVLREVPELPWLRLSSIEANCVDDALLDTVARDDRVCPHLHVPLQSGDEGVLAAMGRPYDVAGFREAVGRVRAALGIDAGLTTDVLVGFPGETDAAFGNTVDLVRELRFTKLHVFRYSPRPGTAASSRKDQIPEDEKKARSAVLRGVGDELSLAFHRSFVGRVLPIMIERAGPAAPARPGLPTLTGTASNYVKVTTQGVARLVGHVAGLRVTDATPVGVHGEVEENGWLGSRARDPAGSRAGRTRQQGRG